MGAAKFAKSVVTPKAGLPVARGRQLLNPVPGSAIVFLRSISGIPSIFTPPCQYLPPPC